jgi:hypothetical protein
LENGESARVAALMVEHAHGARTSINMSRPASRSGENPERPALDR